MSDFPKLATIKSYGGLSRELDLTLAQRWFFLIDKNGTVRGEWSGTTKDVFPSATILEVARKVGGES